MPAETLKPSPKEVAMRVPEMKTGKEKSWVNRLGTAIGDMVRDIGTADQMAKEKFEGDTALMHIAKGSMTTLIGVGLERALDGTWKDALAGKPLLQRPWIQFSEETIKQIKALEISNPRLYTFVTQASKDLATGMVYNGLAFFSRPMLRSAEGEHLLTSLAVDAVDALKPQLSESKVIGPKLSTILSSGLNYSNPATLLGLDMVARGGAALWKNIQDVRKIRKEKGGLEGKKVYISKGNDQREYEHKQYNKNKVYYGRSQWNVSPQQEEEDRAKSM